MRTWKRGLHLGRALSEMRLRWSATARIAPAIGCNSTASPMASAGSARALARPPMNLPARFSRREVSPSIIPKALARCQPTGRSWPATCYRSGPILLPRGGRLAVSANPLAIEAAGEGAALKAEAHAALMLTPSVTELTARTVQTYFTGLHAKTLGCRLIATAEPGRVRLTAIASGI